MRILKRYSDLELFELLNEYNYKVHKEFHINDTVQLLEKLSDSIDT